MLYLRAITWRKFHEMAEAQNNANVHNKGEQRVYATMLDDLFPRSRRIDISELYGCESPFTMASSSPCSFRRSAKYGRRRFYECMHARMHACTLVHSLVRHTRALRSCSQLTANERSLICGRKCIVRFRFRAASLCAFGSFVPFLNNRWIIFAKSLKDKHK